MCPFSVTVHHVLDRELGPLVMQLAQAGFHNPASSPLTALEPPPARPLLPSGRVGISRGVATGAGARRRFVSVAGRARALLTLPRLHLHGARRRHGSPARRRWRPLTAMETADGDGDRYPAWLLRGVAQGLDCPWGRARPGSMLPRPSATIRSPVKRETPASTSLRTRPSSVREFASSSDSSSFVSRAT